MSSKRQVIYDETGMILGGNMRYEAMLDISKKGRSKIESILKEKSTATKDLSGNIDILEPLFHGMFPVGWAVCADNFTDDEKQEFIVKDNVPFGEFDWSELANEWDTGLLVEWGLDIPTSGIEDVNLEEDESSARSDIKENECPKCGYKWNSN